MDNYNDIIKLSRPPSKKPRMSMEQRSAQFASFAALSGFEEQVKETSRLTTNKIEIDEELKYILDIKLKILNENLKLYPEVEILFFIMDEKKDGGKYVTINNKIKKIDYFNKKIIMCDGTTISIENIKDINSKLFKGLNF